MIACLVSDTVGPVFNCVVKSLCFRVLNAYCVFNNCVIAYYAYAYCVTQLRSNFCERQKKIAFAIKTGPMVSDIHTQHSHTF